MTPNQAKRFGAMVRRRREALGMTTTELACKVGTRDSTISRIELGAFATPRPDKLAHLAEHLSLPLADVFAAVGYVVPDELPRWEAYLRTKYPDLPDDAIAELQLSFTRITARYDAAADGASIHDLHRTSRRPSRAAIARSLGKDFG
jgi:transcriptional regulator with XRE-family HTH domain